jgi:16S rRNA processing protein RimM
MSNQPEQEQWLEIGTIVAAQGIQGELRVLSSSDFPERFTRKGNLWLRSPHHEAPQAFTLKSGRAVPGKNLFVIRLAEVTDRNQAEALRDYTLLITAGDRLPLDENEYHVADLINLKAYHHLTGELIGVVKDVYFAGNDLLVIQLEEQYFPQKSANPEENSSARPPQPALIPFVQSIVPIVDLPNQRLEIMPPDGLLELFCGQPLINKIE